jgi:hypothetical protein
MKRLFNLICVLVVCLSSFKISNAQTPARAAAIQTIQDSIRDNTQRLIYPATMRTTLYKIMAAIKDSTDIISILNLQKNHANGILGLDGAGLVPLDRLPVGFGEGSPTWVNAITTTNIANWNNAFSWGNHAGFGYVTQTAGDIRYALKIHSHPLDFLTNVNIINPLNGQALIYNSSTARWENKTAIGSSQADWNATTGPGLILNKPLIPTDLGQLLNSPGFITQSQADSRYVLAGDSIDLYLVGSLTLDGDSIKLVGDVGSPGNNKVYSTNGAGVKGWYTFNPTGDNNYPTSLSFNVGTGILTLGRNGLTPITTSFDGRYVRLDDSLNLYLAGSLTFDEDSIKLAGDITTPGNNKMYATSGSGVKGWYSIPIGAQADWNATTGLAVILNKPSIPGNTNQLVNGSGFITSANVGFTNTAQTWTAVQTFSSNSVFSTSTQSGAATFNGAVTISALGNGTSTRMITVSPAGLLGAQALPSGSTPIFPYGSIYISDGTNIGYDTANFYWDNVNAALVLGSGTGGVGHAPSSRLTVRGFSTTGQGLATFEGNDPDINLSATTNGWTTINFNLFGNPKWIIGRDINSNFYFSRYLSGAYYDNTMTIDYNTGQVTIGNLASATTQMVVANPGGSLSVQPIPTGGGSANNYPTGFTFNSGTLTLNRSGLTDLTAAIGSYYALGTHTHLQSDITGLTTTLADKPSLTTDNNFSGKNAYGNGSVSLQQTFERLSSNVSSGATAVSARSGSKTIFLYNDGLGNYRLDAYDYGGAGSLPIKIAENGGAVLMRQLQGSDLRMVTVSADGTLGAAAIPTGGAGGSDGNNYPNSFSFASGVLNLGRQGLTDLTATIGSYYALSSHTHAYSSLTGLPTIPTNNNQLANGAGYITGANVAFTNATLNSFTGQAIYGTTAKIGSSFGYADASIGIGMNSTVPRITWNMATGATDSKYWDEFVDATSHRFRIVNDAASSGVDWLRADRSGFTIAKVAIPNGAFQVNSLGTGSTKMVTVDGTGNFSTADIPSPSASGTVTSVNLGSLDPTLLRVLGGPITSSGTINIGFMPTQPANKFLASPDGSTGGIDIRSIANTDLPAIIASKNLQSPTISGTPTMSLTGTNALGDIYYRNSSGLLTRLAIGGSNQILTVVSGGPAWRDATNGAAIYTTITSGAVSTVIATIPVGSDEDGTYEATFNGGDYTGTGANQIYGKLSFSYRRFAGGSIIVYRGVNNAVVGNGSISAINVSLSSSSGSIVITVTGASGTSLEWVATIVRTGVHTPTL